MCESTKALLGLPEVDPVEVLGEVDSMKLRSSMTLFVEASDGDEVAKTFTGCLNKFFGGRQDERTQQILKESRS